MTLGYILQLFGQTLRAPRDVAQQILALDWPRQARWQALFLVAVLSIIAAQIIQILSGEVVMTTLLGVTVSLAITIGLAQLIIMVVGAYAADILGRLAGGRGSLDGAILLLAWLQAVLLIFQVIQIALLFALPGLSTLMGLAAFVLSFWLLTVFIAELHGFRSMALVLLSILMTMVLLGLVVSIVLGLLGVQLQLGGL